jgi:hypothetical protein
MSNGKWLNRAGVSFISGAIALAACSAMAGAQSASDEPASNPAQQAPPQRDLPPRRPDRAPPGREANRPERPTVALTGTIQSFNLNPDGLPESLMLKTNDQLVQVNFPPPIGAMINQVSPAGSVIHVQASPDLGLPDHPVYLLRSLKSDKTEQTLAVPTPG